MIRNAATNLQPVSYTHLDVYKRQGVDGNNATLNNGRFLIELKPVSYTHLDVYKRQDTGRTARPRQAARATASAAIGN